MSYRVMLLMKASTYRAPAFSEAAQRLGVDLVQVIDTPDLLAATSPNQLNVDFKDSDKAVERIVSFAGNYPVQAILASDDSGSLLAARACSLLGLPHNRPEAALAARDKFRMRSLLAPLGIPTPWFRRFSTTDDPGQVAEQVAYPCILKPLRRTGSQGVIRANNPLEFVRAVQRLRLILQEEAAGAEAPSFLVEQYIPGVEVALEGMLDEGRLHVLALFDKPDPLEGPFFEETIYVTPSRLAAANQEAIAKCTALAAAALGLHRGPLHAELRLNEQGPWLLEVAGRSIGGLCSRILRFGVDISLEELILRQAVGLEIDSYHRQQGARGVMMIPIPCAGLLRGYQGIEQAQAVPGIEDVTITARLQNLITPLPEGDSYLGFIFAQSDHPEQVEAALREAHSCLRFEIEPVIPLIPR